LKARHSICTQHLLSATTAKVRYGAEEQIVYFRILINDSAAISVAAESSLTLSAICKQP